MKNKTTLAIIVIIGIVILGLAILSERESPATGNVVKTENQKAQSLEPIKIGVSMPLTGEAASLGIGGLTGIELAQKEINANGGINGRKIELVIEDDQCNAKGGSNTLTKLATVDRVTAIIGPFCSAAAGAGVPVVEENKIPIIVWGSAPPLTLNRDYVFRDYPSDSFSGKFLAELMYKEGKRKVAIIYVQNDWGLGMKNVFVKRFTELGGEVVLEEGLAQDSKDLRGALTKLSKKNTDAIFFPVYPNLAVIGLKQMKELDINAPVYSGDVMETPDVIQSGYADGVKYAVGKISNPEDFAEKVKRETGKTSEFATPLGYDSLYIFAEIIEKVGTDPEAIKNELYKYKKTDGISFPVIEFDNEGDLKEAIYDVKVIEDGEARVIN